MRNFLKALCYIVPFLAFLGGTLLFTALLVQTEYGALPHAEFAADSLISATTFCKLVFSTLALCCMASAFGVVKMLDRRS
jgi:hypothetical protein